ncbi:MAG TPA: hypothetical protein VGB60_10090 [Brevundimonas sp.]|jgi:hypothetical protein|uniref:hypothetical protein n=1 Tax=Brevundimonas sp. TaxID=1871086 RepID=UPI002ED8258F
MTDPNQASSSDDQASKSHADAPRPDQDAGPKSGAGKPAENPATPATGASGAAGAGSPAGFGRGS